MSTHTTALKSRAGAMSLFAENLSDRLSSMKATLVAHAERRRVAAELSRMSDRDLADIGITRSEIPRVAGYERSADPSYIAR